jgi:transposase
LIYRHLLIYVSSHRKLRQERLLRRDGSRPPTVRVEREV